MILRSHRMSDLKIFFGTFDLDSSKANIFRSNKVSVDYAPFSRLEFNVLQRCQFLLLVLG